MQVSLDVRSVAHGRGFLVVFVFFKDTATTEIYTLHIVGSVRCVQETGINAEYMGRPIACLYFDGIAAAPAPADGSADPQARDAAGSDRGHGCGHANVNLAPLELNRSILEGKQGVIAADADIEAGIELGATLAKDDRAGRHDLPAVSLHAPVLGIAIAAVT
eukprot:TRINITY_DN24326_c0_g1_i3.p2 TRINITY_DN24326_c0_g1~~TRINITY_DN24326_c0_g1_i3.p2  ORF type:complete len:162 (+),score=21.50 TRINITY_DN24326_c0_g1_i3:36-521(+)